MFRAFRDLTISGRLWLVGGFVVACLAGQLAMSLMALGHRADRTMRERENKLRAAVETAYGVIEHQARLADAGKVSREQAQRQALETMRGIRYQGDEYFWVNDLDTRMLMHPIKPEMEGREYRDYADPAGKRIFSEFVRTVRADPTGGFVEYRWPKPGQTAAVRKLSFVKLYEPWGWVIGSGLYLDDIDDAASADMWLTIGLTALVVTLLAGAGMYVRHMVNKAVGHVRQVAGELETAVREGRLSKRALPEAVAPEFRGIVAGMNATMDAFTKPIVVTAEYVSRISLGDVPPPIAERYEGDFDAIKSSMNHLIEVVQMRDRDIHHLIESALAGRLDERVDTSAYQGDNGKLLAGINSMLDAILAPVQEASQVLERLARRDLRARMTGDYRGGHAKMKQALNTTAEALHDALTQVSVVAGQVSSAAEQIASSAQSVASGASEQASSLQETSSALESMASTTRQSTDSAQHANELARQASQAASEGGTATEQMTQVMARVKASAEGTSQIIKDINEIAFQTNLLALNAAVEAARAGEAGRGFAVVAEEVRSLALRSKEAASKTEELIRQSVRETGEGEVTAQHVARQLSEIVGAIGKVSGIVAEIAATSKEQLAGIDQVNDAIAQMNQVTQQNAASSEESSSAAAELSGQSRELASMIGTFELEHHATGRDPDAQPRKHGGRPAGVPAHLAAHLREDGAPRFNVPTA